MPKEPKPATPPKVVFSHPELQAEWDALAATAARVTPNGLSEFVLTGTRILNKEGALFGEGIRIPLLALLKGFDEGQLWYCLEALEIKGLVRITRTWREDDGNRYERSRDCWEVVALPAPPAEPSEGNAGHIGFRVPTPAPRRKRR